MQSLIKEKLREQIHAEIAALPDDYVSDSDKGIFLQVKSLKEYINARNIFIYHSVGKEPDTLGIINDALTIGKTVAIPRCYKGGAMEPRVIRNLDELRPSMLGIPAPPDSAEVAGPEELELIIVPALTYDRAGYRLGYGGGYYDRYLLRTSAFTVGLARERLIMDELPREPHDIAVKCLITEKRGEIVAHRFK